MNFSNSYLDFEYYKFDTPNISDLNKEMLILLPPEILEVKEDQVLIANIIKAVKLEPSMYSKVILQENDTFPLSLHPVYSNLKYVLSFGIKPARLGLNFIAKPLIDFDSVRYFFTVSTKQLGMDKEQKMILWQNLKSTFNK